MKKYFLWLFVIFTSNYIFAQQSYVAPQPNFSIGLQKAMNNITAVGSLFTYTNNQSCVHRIGKSGLSIYTHAVYQWNISDLEIPMGSTIHSVTVIFKYIPVPYSPENVIISFFNCNMDITASNLNLTDLWNKTDHTIQSPICNVGYTPEGNNFFIKGNFNNGSNFVNQFQTSIDQNDKFTLGLAMTGEDPTTFVISWDFYTNYIYPVLSVSFTPPTRNVILDQRLSDNTQIGKIRKWEGSDFTAYPFLEPGTSCNFYVNSLQTILGDQAIYSNEKYYSWKRNGVFEPDVINHHTFQINNFDNTFISLFNPAKAGTLINTKVDLTEYNIGIVEFKDPWLIDSIDVAFNNNKKNRGNDAIFKQRIVPFNPDFNSSYGGDIYKGVFLNQNPNFLNGLPIYKVKAITPQTINIGGSDRKFYFQNWSAEPAASADFQNYLSLQTPVVFKNENAIVSANYKGNLISNHQSGFSSNNQNKILRTYNGKLHIVYESQNKIWYSFSTDNGATWSQDIIVSDPDYVCKSPSISAYIHGTNISMVYIREGIDAFHPTSIVLKEIENNTIVGNEKIVFAADDYASTYNFNPVIASSGDYTINEYTRIVVWQMPNQGGLKIKGISGYGENWTETAVQCIPGTSKAVNPSIICNDHYGSTHLAWEQETNSGAVTPDGILTDINYVKVNYYYNSNSISYSDFCNLSSGSSYTENRYPRISFDQNNILVTWTGINLGNNSIEKSLEDQSIASQKAIARFGSMSYSPPCSTNWESNYYIAGNDVKYTSNTCIGNDNPANSGGIIIWSENDGQETKFCKRKNGNYQPIQTMDKTGAELQSTNGNNTFNTVHASVMNNSSSPFFIDMLQADFIRDNEWVVDEGEGGSQLKTSSLNQLAISRSGIINKDGIRYVFRFGDIKCDRKKIKIPPVSSGFVASGISDLNENLRTENFFLKSSDKLSFTNAYYVLKNGITDSLLTDNAEVKFKVELVRSNTNEVVGIFDKISFNKNKLNQRKKQRYTVNCSNITEGNYYIRLSAEVNEDAQLYLSDNYLYNSQINKDNIKEVDFTGQEMPTQFSLSQNYPNPFNPTTKINYTIPLSPPFLNGESGAGGFVTLKVYDLLGKEVALLVNENQNAGSYSVDFSGKNLSAGIYFYELNAGSFREIKKMILLK